MTRFSRNFYLALCFAPFTLNAIFERDEKSRNFAISYYNGARFRTITRDTFIHSHTHRRGTATHAHKSKNGWIDYSVYTDDGVLVCLHRETQGRQASTLANRTGCQTGALGRHQRPFTGASTIGSGGTRCSVKQTW